jgi:hypothetical protein
LWVFIFWWFFLAMGHLASLSFQKNMKSPLLKLHFTFTLLYIYIFLHSHVRSYKYIYFYIYIVLLDRVQLYKFIYTYTECKFQTIYTHNTGRDLINGSDPQALANCMCSTSSQQASNQKPNNCNVHSQVIVSDHRFMNWMLVTLKNNLHKMSSLHDCLKDKAIPSWKWWCLLNLGLSLDN